MPPRAWPALLAAVIVLGLLSRAVPTGHPLTDKYLGDALYAEMVYILIRLSRLTPRVALAAAIVMLAIELFQLTLIPAALAQSNHLPLRLAARLLGTHFSPLDLLAYAAGIAPLALLETRYPE